MGSPVGIAWGEAIPIYSVIFGGEWTFDLYRRLRVLERGKLEALAEKQAPK
jgi:hypothetical protein